MLSLNRIKAFSLIEMMIVVVIVGILLAVAIPSYQNAIERGRGRNAEFNLRSIYSAQQRYFLENKCYYTCTQGIPLPIGFTCTPEELAQNLSVDLSDPYFGYVIIALPNQFNTTGSINLTAKGSFFITAWRQGGSLCRYVAADYPEGTMQIGFDGNITKNCDAW